MNCNAHYPMLIDGMELACDLEKGHDGMHMDMHSEEPSTYEWE